MSGLEILIPLIVSAVGSTAAAVGTAAAAIGSTVFAGAAALTAGVGLTGTLAAVATGALSSAVIGAAVGGVGSVVTGGDFLDGVKNGAIMGAVTGGVAGGFGLGAAGAGATDVTAGDFPTSVVGAGGSFDGTTGALSDAATGAGTAAPSTFTGFNTGAGVMDEAGLAQSATGGAPNADSVARLGSVANSGGGVAAPAGGPAANGAAGKTGGFGGFSPDTNNLIGGTLNGVGKVLSGDTQQGAIEARNKGDMDLQHDKQAYTSANYDIKGGLLPNTNSSGDGRPTPTEQFGDTSGNRVGTGEWEYYFDGDTHALKRRPVTS